MEREQRQREREGNGEREKERMKAKEKERIKEREKGGKREREREMGYSDQSTMSTPGIKEKKPAKMMEPCYTSNEFRQPSRGKN